MGMKKRTRRGGGTPKKRKLQPSQARSELSESDNDDDIAPTATREPVGGGGG
jgi:hypothetical protein